MTTELPTNTPYYFSEKFKNIDTDLIVRELTEKGYFVFESAINQQAIEVIEYESTQTKLNLNSNVISGVFAENQYYFTNLLCTSKTFYDYVTSDFVLQVCEKYLGDEFRLKALRYYETYGGHHMQWHTDNKTDKKVKVVPGIIFIFYISDVEEGQFQYVEGSHIWSGENAYSNYSDEFIEKNYSDKIKDFKETLQKSV